jgi:hypothetical protein
MPKTMTTPNFEDYYISAGECPPLAKDAEIVDCRAVGHAYKDYGDDPEGKFAGDALSLETTGVHPAPVTTGGVVCVRS